MWYNVIWERNMNRKKIKNIIIYKPFIEFYRHRFSALRLDISGFKDRDWIGTAQKLFLRRKND